MTRRRHLTPAVGLTLTLALVAAACGGGGSSSEGEKGGDSGGAVASLEDVKTATVQIVSQGTFAEPAGSLAAFQEVAEAGSGSGFIIDPEGIAVTNNHVVTGAATLEVFVGGSDESVSAKVLGVSECSDLAVIDLEGDGYPTVAWTDEPATAGAKVFAAGFPLGDPEYTLLDGIVAKEEADGDTNWASVDHVIEHTAPIQPGNSGGPLVTEDGRVVAVNYAGGDPGTGTSQFFAISADLAEPVVDQLREGTDVLALGVNGEAFVDEESGLSGIWVASVDTNSPAGELGLQGGDIIERIEGLPVGADGTMADYCKILESHDPGDKLSVQVLRFADGTRYRGEFNGDELAPYESIVEQQVDEGSVASGAAYTDYVEVTDDSGIVAVQVPVEWSDVDGSAAVLDDGTEIPSLVAAPSVSDYFQTFDVPGVTVQALPGGDVGPADLVGQFTFEDACTSSGPQEYSDPLYTGLIQVWEGCGGTATQIAVVGAQPQGGEFSVLVIFQIVTDADIDAATTILNTFVVRA